MHQFSTSRDIFRIIYSKLKIMVAYKKKLQKRRRKKNCKNAAKRKSLRIKTSKRGIIDL